MRYFFLLLISMVAMADDFVPGKDGPYKFYDYKSECEQVESVECYSVDACPLLYCEIYEVIEDGVTKKKLAENPVKKAEYDAAITAAQASATDKADGCQTLGGMGAALDTIRANITSTEAGTITQLRQAQNAKNEAIADALKIVKRCLK
jgi:hypothetical protein